MSIDDANHILDLARSGAPVHEGVITAALYRTGDADMPPWLDWLDADAFSVAIREST